jgi:hypothetical protein
MPLRQLHGRATAPLRTPRGCAIKVSLLGIEQPMQPFPIADQIRIRELT